MTKSELIDILFEMQDKMATILADLTVDPCKVQKDVDVLYDLALFLPYSSDADEEDEDEDEDEDDDDDDDEDEWKEGYEEGYERGHEEGYVDGYNEGLSRVIKL